MGLVYLPNGQTMEESVYRQTKGLDPITKPSNTAPQQTSTSVPAGAYQETIEKGIEAGVSANIKKTAAEQLKTIDDWKKDYPEIKDKYEDAINSMEKNLASIKASDATTKWEVKTDTGTRIISRSEAINLLSKDLSNTKRDYGMTQAQYEKITSFEGQYGQELRLGVSAPNVVFSKYRESGAEWFGTSIPGKYGKFSSTTAVERLNFLAQAREKAITEFAESPQAKLGLALTLHDPLFITSGLTGITSYVGERWQGKSSQEAFRVAAYNVHGIRRNYAAQAYDMTAQGMKGQFIAGEMATGAAFGAILALPGLATVPGVIGAGARVAGTGLWGYQLYETYKNPTGVNIAYSAAPLVIHGLTKGYTAVRAKAFGRTVELNPKTYGSSKYGVLEISGFSKKISALELAGMLKEIRPEMTTAELVRAVKGNEIVFNTARLYEMAKNPKGYTTGANTFSFKESPGKFYSAKTAIDYNFNVRYRVVDEIPKVPEYTRMNVETARISWKISAPDVLGSKYIILENYKILPESPRFLTDIIKPSVDVSRRTPFDFSAPETNTKINIKAPGIETATGNQKLLLNPGKTTKGKTTWQAIGYDQIDSSIKIYYPTETINYAPSPSALQLAGISGLGIEPIEAVIEIPKLSASNLVKIGSIGKLSINVKSIQKVSYKQNFDTRLNTKGASDIRIDTKGRLSLREATKQYTAQRSILRTNARLSMRAKFNEIQKPKQRTSSATVTAQKNFTIRSPKITKTSAKESKTKKKGKVAISKKYDVYIRRYGKFSLLASGLGRIAALRLGAKTAKETPAASFKISFAGFKFGREKKGKADLGQFYKKGNVFIEKSAFRINQPSEVAGISYKGLVAIRNKRLRL